MDLVREEGRDGRDPADLGRRAVVLPARGHPAVRARRGRAPEPDARPPRPLPLDGRLRRRQGAHLREPARGAGRGPECGRPARRAHPAAGAAVRVLARADPGARDGPQGRTLPRRRHRQGAARRGPARGPRAARHAQRRERSRGPRRDSPAGGHGRDRRRDDALLPRIAAPHGSRQDAERRGVLQRLQGHEHRRDAQEPRGVRRRKSRVDPRRQGQGRRLRPAPADGRANGKRSVCS